MVKRKKLEKWIKKRIQVISDRLTTYCTVRREEEDLHKIRVEIKKLRALLYLLRNLSGHKYKTEKVLLKDIFRHAGRIRDAQLQLHIISELHIEDPAFIYEELKRKEREENLLALRLEEYQYNIKKVKKGLLKKLDNIDLLEAESLIKLEWDKIHVFLLSTADAERMHDERKKIKQLIYLLRILPEEIADNLDIDRKYLDDLADKIGKWHDLLITVQMLKGRKEPADMIAPIDEKAREKLEEVKAMKNRKDLRF
jgi:CHAD domain-containing protein